MTPKQELINYLKNCLDYCQEQNGMPMCKNCGLDNEVFTLIDKIPDFKAEIERRFNNNR
jgi:hypothetical protein